MGQYKSQHTGPQIDAGVDAALNPDVTVTPDSDALVTSGAVADALDNIDPTITSDTDTTLNGILVGNGSKVGTKSLDTSSLTNDADHVPSSSVVKSALTSLESNLASIQATGNTNATGSAITNGTYFYLNGILVQAKADIASGATFTNGTNYTVVTAGALNELKSALQIKTGTKTGTTNASGLLALDDDPATTIVIAARLDGHNGHTLCLLDFYSFGTTELWAVKAFDSSNFTPLANNNITVKYYYITK